MTSLRLTSTVRRVIFAGLVSVMLAGCASGAAGPTHSQRLAHERTACELVGAPATLATSGASSFSTVFVKRSLFGSLAASGSAQLREVGRELRTATLQESRTGNDARVVHALDKAIGVCHRLELSITH